MHPGSHEIACPGRIKTLDGNGNKPGSPRENGHHERFNGKLSDEALNREVFHNLKETAMIIEKWG